MPTCPALPLASKPQKRATYALAAALGAAPGPAWAHNFVGAESCGTCHTFAYEVWRKGPHAQAHQSLTEGQLTDARCAACHSNLLAAVGAGAGPSGTGAPVELAVGERDAPRGERPNPLVAAAKDGALLGVQCEQCHGAGKLYQPDYVMRDRELSRLLGLVDATATGCLACHTEGAPSLEPFSYRTAWARIDHGRGARERWEQARATELVPAPTAELTPAEAPAAPAPSRAAASPPRPNSRGRGRRP